jgi:predicted HTH transcriptional regulator
MYEVVATFFQEHVRENERIEYKAVFGDTLSDSLVSIANGQGGFIFIGVSERKSDKIPIGLSSHKPFGDRPASYHQGRDHHLRRSDPRWLLPVMSTTARWHGPVAGHLSR